MLFKKTMSIKKIIRIKEVQKIFIAKSDSNL